jgi:filamentous hemagglutinin
MYPDTQISDLTETQKQMVSTLSQIAAGLAGGIASDSSMGVGAGVGAAKNAVENNALSVKKTQSLITELAQCQTDKACRQGVTEKYAKLNAEQHLSVVQCPSAKECVAKANEMGELQKEYANRLNELGEKARANGSLSAEDQQEWTYLNSVLPMLEADRSAAIKNALDSGESAEAKQLAVNGLAQAIGTSAAGIATGIGKKGTKEPNTSNPAGNTSSFDANEIRFSQNTVSYNKAERDSGVRYTYDDLVSSMKKDGWKGDPVDVVKMPDGNMTSMDNIRINAARDAGIKVEANVRNFSDPLPKDMIDSGRFGSATTWGEAITGRINNQSGGFGKNNPYGSSDAPRITGKGK